jgi:hypothetical protein
MRLTDKALAELEDVALLRLSEQDREEGYRLDGAMALRARDEAAKHHFVNLVLELKERRAQDLTADEVGALKWAAQEFRWEVEHAEAGSYGRKCQRVLSILDRLTAGQGESK